MRIVLLEDWHSEKMGYSDNFLPGALVSLGHEVHLVTSNGQVYFNSPEYKALFEPFLGPGVVECGSRSIDGYTVHRLPYGEWRGRIRIRGLIRRLHALRPDIVQAGEFTSLATYQAALAKRILGYKLFVECHVHASAFPPAARWGGIRERFNWLVFAATVGRFVSSVSEKCYPISLDAAEIAVQFFGVEQHKIEVRPLGADTNLFRPPSDEASQKMRRRLREQLGFPESAVVCVYTGRFSSWKNPLCLAKAVGALVARGEPFRALFVGNGSPEEVEAIKAVPGCVVHSFVPVRDLPAFYWAADIGVWPRQESTSQLDAAACGLPIIVSNRVRARERVEGNGLVYEEDDADDLARQLRALAAPETRRRMGGYGARKIREQFGWERIAEGYVKDYEAALR